MAGIPSGTNQYYRSSKSKGYNQPHKDSKPLTDSEKINNYPTFEQLIKQAKGK